MTALAQLTHKKNLGRWRHHYHILRRVEMFDFGTSLRTSHTAPTTPINLIGPSMCWSRPYLKIVFLVFRLWPQGALESKINIGHFQIELGSALISDPLYILTIFLHFYNEIGYGLSFYQQKIWFRDMPKKVFPGLWIRQFSIWKWPILILLSSAPYGRNRKTKITIFS